MPTSLLHSSVNVSAPVISHIANLSFSQCQFPAAFKMAQVLPLPKKPSLDNEQMTSYWPISNLTTISKIIEQLVLNRGPPTCIAVLRMPAVGILLRAINKDSATIRLESSVRGHQQQRNYHIGRAASNTINHDVLISHLENQFSVDGGAFSWLSSYLTNRSQYVKLAKHSRATM